MNIRLFNTKQARLLKQALDVYGKQHKAIAQNVANAKNPNYSRVKTDFSQALQSAVGQSNMKTTRGKHIQLARFRRGGADAAAGDRSDRVDLTREMTELAENQIKYDFVTRVLSRYYRSLSTSVTGRNR